VLGQQDVGHRVVVRRFVGISDDRPLYSDALGELLEIDGTGLTVATARGPVRVALADVRAAKRVPPKKDIAGLERVASRCWPAVERDRLGEWELRASAGWTGRGNSALPLGDPGLPLPAAIEAVTRWYAERGLPARVNVPLPVAALVDAELTARDWARSVPTLVQTAPLADIQSVGAPVRLAEEPDEAWLAMVGGWKGRLPEVARQILTGPPDVRFASVVEAGRLVAVGRGALVSGYLQIALIHVTPAARRRGLAAQVTRTLAEWGGAAGGHTAFLQVESTNAGAVALYASLGFTTHHRYVTRTLSA
jgi:N-acetylglutamate synthase